MFYHVSPSPKPQTSLETGEGEAASHQIRLPISPSDPLLSALCFPAPSEPCSLQRLSHNLLPVPFYLEIPWSGTGTLCKHLCALPLSFDPSLKGLTFRCSFILAQFAWVALHNAEGVISRTNPDSIQTFRII